MKKFKSGFTLAEVLITLSIIGIVAAIVMPSVMSSYQYKTVGVRLSKFAASTEQAARAYVVQNDSFPTTRGGNNNTNMGIVVDFINDTFLTTSIVGANNTTQTAFTAGGINDLTNTSTQTAINTGTGVVTPANNQFVATLKDGTQIAFSMFTSNALPTGNGVAIQGFNNSIGDGSRVGMPSFDIAFMPNANGLPASVQKRFDFVVTELGYVYPSAADTCLWNIYNAQWMTNNATFRSTSNGCVTSNGANASASASASASANP